MRAVLLDKREVQISNICSRRVYGRFGRANMVVSKVTESFQADEKLICVLHRMTNCYGAQIFQQKKGLIVSLISNGGNNGIIQLHDETDFIKDFSSIFGVDNVRVKLTMRHLLHYEWRDSSLCNNILFFSDIREDLATKEMRILIDDPERTCMEKIQFNSEAFIDCLNNEQYVPAFLVTMEMIINNWTEPQTAPKKMVICEKMLQDEIHCDVAIVTCNGNLLKCHKSLLSACSSVLAANFQTDMMESITNQIEILDMTEEAVKAFLSYVYCLDEEEPNKHCGIAFELLYAGHKYNVVPNLEKAMIDLILSKPTDWFQVDDTIKMFSLARNIPNGDELMNKCVQVLKSKSKELGQSEAYKTLFVKDSAAAMELCQLAFSNME